MRIAICISGGFRNCKELYPNFKKYILDNPLYESDIYISSWNSKINHFKTNIPDEATIEEVLDLYKPKNYSYMVYDEEMRKSLYQMTRMDQFQQWAKKNRTVPRRYGRWSRHTQCKVCLQKGFIGGKCRICGGENVHNQIGMLYNIWKCHGRITERYDLCLRTRFDNVYSQSFEQKHLDAAMATWMIPAGDNDFDEYGGGANDQLCLTRQDLMDKYADIVWNISHFAYQNYNSYGGYGIPHKSINNMAEKESIKITRPIFKYALQKRIDGK